MKTFSPFVRRHFSASPRVISASFILVCFLIEFPIVFSLKTLSCGTYFYFDSNGIKQIDTFYFYDSSEFSLTLIGKFLVIFTSIFLNFFLTLVVEVTLNIISVYQYTSYLKERRQRDHAYARATYNIPNDSTNIEIVAIPKPKSSAKENKERKAEKNMLYMALTLCTISIISRILLMIGYVYFFLFYSFTTTLLIALVN
jgi:hypothetical protein